MSDDKAEVSFRGDIANDIANRFMNERIPPLEALTTIGCAIAVLLRNVDPKQGKFDHETALLIVTAATLSALDNPTMFRRPSEAASDVTPEDFESD